MADIWIYDALLTAEACLPAFFGSPRALPLRRSPTTTPHPPSTSVATHTVCKKSQLSSPKQEPPG